MNTLLLMLVLAFVLASGLQYRHETDEFLDHRQELLELYVRFESALYNLIKEAAEEHAVKVSDVVLPFHSENDIRRFYIAAEEVPLTYIPNIYKENH